VDQPVHTAPSAHPRGPGLCPAQVERNYQCTATVFYVALLVGLFAMIAYNLDQVLTARLRTPVSVRVEEDPYWMLPNVVRGADAPRGRARWVGWWRAREGLLALVGVITGGRRHVRLFPVIGSTPHEIVD
jgi:hypothetical protein